MMAAVQSGVGYSQASVAESGCTPACNGSSKRFLAPPALTQCASPEQFSLRPECDHSRHESEMARWAVNGHMHPTKDLYSTTSSARRARHPIPSLESCG